MPPAVVSVTWAGPTTGDGGITKSANVPLGSTATTAADRSTDVESAKTMCTVEAPGTNPVPSSATGVVASCRPDGGVIDVAVGTARYVKVSAGVVVPPSVVTVTSAAPEGPLGVRKDRLLPLASTVTAAAGTVVAPTVTVVAPGTKPEPWIVTGVPPAVGPSVGARLVAVGNGR